MVAIHGTRHKAMITLECNCQNKKSIFVTVNDQNACKIKFADHFWPPYHYERQSESLLFAIIYFDVCKKM